MHRPAVNSVAELFGRRAVIGDDWTRIIREQQCPFLVAHRGLEQDAYQNERMFLRSILDHGGPVVLGAVSNYSFK